MPTSTIGTLGQFLRSRRAALTPEDVGITSFGRRRVPGLRREELARLAGVSVAYYTRLEQGQAANASPAVIDALARALRLDEDERAHAHALASSQPHRRPRAPRPPQVHARTAQLLEAMATVPALVLGPRTEILAWNRLGHALFAGHLPRDAPGSSRTRPNLTRLLFLDAHVRGLHREWAHDARLAVSSLRYVGAELPDDAELATLVGELSLASSEFASLWSQHPVKQCTAGIKRLHHPLVGPIDLEYQVLGLPDAGGQRLVTYVAAPGSPSASAVELLSALTAPPARA